MDRLSKKKSDSNAEMLSGYVSLCKGRSADGEELIGEDAFSSEYGTDRAYSVSLGRCVVVSSGEASRSREQPSCWDSESCVGLYATRSGERELVLDNWAFVRAGTFGTETAVFKGSMPASQADRFSKERYYDYYGYAPRRDFAPGSSATFPEIEFELPAVQHVVPGRLNRDYALMVADPIRGGSPILCRKNGRVSSNPLPGVRFHHLFSFIEFHLKCGLSGEPVRRITLTAPANTLLSGVCRVDLTHSDDLVADDFSQSTNRLTLEIEPSDRHLSDMKIWAVIPPQEMTGERLAIDFESEHYTSRTYLMEGRRFERGKIHRESVKVPYARIDYRMAFGSSPIEAIVPERFSCQGLEWESLSVRANMVGGRTIMNSYSEGLTQLLADSVRLKTSYDPLRARHYYGTLCSAPFPLEEDVDVIVTLEVSTSGASASLAERLYVWATDGKATRGGYVVASSVRSTFSVELRLTPQMNRIALRTNQTAGRQHRIYSLHIREK